MTVFLGTLWSSTKQIEAPYLFDWENAITLHEMHGNRASSRGEGNSHLFARVASGNWGIFPSERGCPFETGVCSANSGHLSPYDGQRSNVN